MDRKEDHKVLTGFRSAPRKVVAIPNKTQRSKTAKNLNDALVHFAYSFQEEESYTHTDAESLYLWVGK